MRSSVVFPAPFGPSRARHSPAPSARDTSSRTAVDPYDFRRRPAAIIAEPRRSARAAVWTPPARAGTLDLHGAEASDPFLGRRMRGEQARDPATPQRVDDE